ncbi:hypothetical protein D9M72_523530 [compost metagenome]
MRHPFFLDDDAFHADLRCGRSDHAGVVRLHAADRDQGVSAGGDRIRNDVFEFPEFVAAHGETGIAVFALGIDLDFSAKCCRQPRQMLDRRRAEGERVAFELFEQ